VLEILNIDPIRDTISNSYRSSSHARRGVSLALMVAGIGRVRTEYLFAKFPTTNALGGILDNAGGANVLHGSSDLTIQTARPGLNYRF
jgi:hypothetical protein